MDSIKKSIRSVEDLQEFKISTRLLLEMALSRGYEVEYFYSSPSTMSGVARCRRHGKEFFIKSTCTAMTPSLGVFAAENKVLTNSLLKGNGVSTPDSISRLTKAPVDDDVIAFMKKHGKIVVKPAAMNHGDGVSVGVDTVDRLEEAVTYVQSITTEDSDILYQQQIEGKEYRFLVVAGKVIAVSHRRPPFVVGDGVRTVRELINEKNLDPRRGSGHSSILTYISLQDVERHNEEGFLDIIPLTGQELNVLSTSNLSRGGEAIDYTDRASKAIKSIAVDAAKYCFLGVAGVDIITNDITAESSEGSYVIEVNLTPGIRMHEAPSIGRPRQVAKLIFKEIEKTAQPIDRTLKHIGRVENITLPELSGATMVRSRIDSGATVSSVWASDIEVVNGRLHFTLFGEPSDLYDGKRHIVEDYSRRIVTSSMGHTEERYQIKTPVVLKGRRILATVTLADRSKQTYPVLVGRNILRNKFIVDVSQGVPSRELEAKKRLISKGLGV